MTVSMPRVDGFFRASVMLNKVTVLWPKVVSAVVDETHWPAGKYQPNREEMCFIEYQFIFF